MNCFSIFSIIVVLLLLIGAVESYLYHNGYLGD